MRKLMLLCWICTSSFAQNFDIQGHRGCRGLLPENTIEAFKKAITLGVTTLEMDVVISKDLQVVVSHEPYLSHEICLDKLGNFISEEKEKSFNLFAMNYSEIKECDCGSKKHPRFPEQTNIKTYKPLLSEVITFVEEFVRKEYPNKKIYYNIETKLEQEGDGIFHPNPNDFVALLIKVLHQKNIEDRVFIQSFDVRTLQYLHSNYPEYKTVLLVENKLSIAKNLAILGFTPTVYSPDFHLLNSRKIKELQQKNIRVIPWTVNETKDMQRLIAMGVDGIITDYPNRYFDLKP